jgi:DNA invertase Pin-like site-specific DNA recombinase
MKKACLYVRVSTDEQADKGFSQRDQAERLQIHCLRNDIEVKQIIFEDYSAKTFNRPEWTKLLLALKKTKGRDIDYVMFTKWDQFSRDTADAYQMIRKLTIGYQVEPIAIEQPLDLSVPESKTIHL